MKMEAEDGRADDDGGGFFSLDYGAWDVRVAVIGGGFALYSCVFLLTHLVSQALSVTYNSLHSQERAFWSLAATRAVFGVKATFAGLWTLLADRWLFEGLVWRQCWWSWALILTTVGFFLFENLALHVSSAVFGGLDLGLAVHHALSALGFLTMVLWDSTGHYLAIVILLLEMSTPFTCISWMLLKAGYAKTLLWRVNQMVMIHMFHGRMFLTYYLWWESWRNRQDLVNHVSLPTLVIFYTGLFVLTVYLNPYWTYKKTLQLANPVDWNFANKDMNRNGHKVADVINKKHS